MIDFSARLFVLVALVAISPLCVLAQTDDKSGDKTKKKEPAKTFVVVQVNKDFQVVASAGVKELKTRLDKEFREKVAAYNLAKKEAKESKQKFTDPKPKKAVFKVVSKPLPTEEKAKEHMAKLKADSKKKKTDKKKPKPKKKDDDNDDG